MSDALKRPVAVVELSNGETVHIQPFTGKHFILSDSVPSALADIGEFVRKMGTDLVSGADADGNLNIGAIPVERILRECRAPVATLIREACPQPDEWWDTLDIDDIVLLAGAVFAVNQERHGKKVAAALVKLFGANPNA